MNSSEISGAGAGVPMPQEGGGVNEQAEVVKLVKLYEDTLQRVRDVLLETGKDEELEGVPAHLSDAIIALQTLGKTHEAFLLYNGETEKQEMQEVLDYLEKREGMIALSKILEQKSKEMAAMGGVSREEPNVAPAPDEEIKNEAQKNEAVENYTNEISALHEKLNELSATYGEKVVEHLGAERQVLSEMLSFLKEPGVSAEEKIEFYKKAGKELSAAKQEIRKFIGEMSSSELSTAVPEVAPRPPEVVRRIKVEAVGERPKPAAAETGKIYENPAEDPAVIKIKEEVEMGIRREAGNINPSIEERNKFFGSVSRAAWDKFILENPEKAEAYRTKYGQIADAFLRRESGKEKTPEVKIFDNPAKDPVIAGVNEEITRTIHRELGGDMSPEKVKRNLMFGPMARAAWDRFVLELPEKAAAYRNKYVQIKDALERVEGANLGEVARELDEAILKFKEAEKSNNPGGYLSVAMSLRKGLEKRQAELISADIPEEEKKKKFASDEFKDYLRSAKKFLKGSPDEELGGDIALSSEKKPGEISVEAGKSPEAEMERAEVVAAAGEIATEVLADPSAIVAAAEAALPPDASEEEREKLAAELGDREVQKNILERINNRISEYVVEKGGWASMLGGLAAGAGMRAAIRKSFRYGLGSNLAVGIAAGAAGGALVGAVKEVWEEKRKFQASSALEQFAAADTTEKKALIYSKAKELYEQKKISGNAEGLEKLAVELRSVKTLLDVEKEAMGLAGKERILAILKIVEKNADDIDVSEKKEITSLIKKIKFERGPLELKKIGWAAARGALMGAFGGAIGGAITGYIADHISHLGGGEKVAEGAVKKAVALVGEEKAQSATEKSVSAVGAVQSLGREITPGAAVAEKSFAAANEVARKNLDEMTDAIVQKEFSVDVEKGDGLTRVARKGIHDMVANFAKLGYPNDFPAEKMVYAEDWLQKRLAEDGIANLQPGEHIDIPGERIFEALEKADVLKPEQITNLGEIIKNAPLSEETLEFMKNESATFASDSNNFYEGAASHLTSDEVVGEAKEAVSAVLQESSGAMAEEAAHAATEEAVAGGVIVGESMGAAAEETAGKTVKEAIKEVAVRKTISASQKLFWAVIGAGSLAAGGVGGYAARRIMSDRREKKEAQRLEKEKTLESKDVLDLLTKINHESKVSLSIAEDVKLTAEDSAAIEQVIAKIKAVGVGDDIVSISIGGLTKQKPKILASGEIVVDKKYLSGVAEWLKSGGRAEKVKERTMKRRAAEREMISINVTSGDLPSINLMDDMLVEAEDVQRLGRAIKKAAEELAKEGKKFVKGDITLGSSFSAKFNDSLFVKAKSSEEKMVEYIKKNFGKNE